MRICIGNLLDETTLILVVNQVEGVIGPNLFDLFDVLFESHLPGRLTNGSYGGRHQTNLSLGLNDDLLDQGLIFLEIHVIDMSQCHPEVASNKQVNRPNR